MNRVLFISPSASTHGGFESVICRLCKLLPDYGWDAVLGLARGANFHNPDRFVAENGPLKMIEIDGTHGTFDARRAGLENAILKTAPDIVVGGRIFDVIPAINSLRRRGFSRPFVEMLGSWDADYFSDLHRYREIIDFCVVDSCLLERVVVAKCGIAPERVRRIPTGVVRPLALERVPEEKQIRLCYVGRLDDEDKRACDLVPLVHELCQRNVDFLLTVAGDGRDRSKIEKRLETEVANGCVRFQGWLTAEDLHTFFQRQDVLVQFSPAEGLTISPREGLVHGVVPVLSEFIGFFTEGIFLQEENCLSFPVGQISVACDQILRLHNDRNLLSRLSQNARHSQEGPFLAPDDIKAWGAFLSEASMAPASSACPANEFPEDSGRLNRFPTIVRHLLRRYSRHIHTDAGGEWPHASGWTTDDERHEFERFALAQEQQNRTRSSKHAEISCAHDAATLSGIK